MAVLLTLKFETRRKINWIGWMNPMLDTRFERRLQGTLTGGARSLIEISALSLAVEFEDSLSMMGLDGNWVQHIEWWMRWILALNSRFFKLGCGNITLNQCYIIWSRIKFSWHLYAYLPAYLIFYYCQRSNRDDWESMVRMKNYNNLRNSVHSETLWFFDFCRVYILSVVHSDFSWFYACLSHHSSHVSRERRNCRRHKSQLPLRVKEGSWHNA